MKQIIQKARDGGFSINPEKYNSCFITYEETLCQREFWEALSKSCVDDSYASTRDEWSKHSYTKFFTLNYEKGWDAAVEYLTSITK